MAPGMFRRELELARWTSRLSMQLSVLTTPRIFLQASLNTCAEEGHPLVSMARLKLRRCSEALVPPFSDGAPLDHDEIEGARVGHRSAGDISGRHRASKVVVGANRRVEALDIRKCGGIHAGNSRNWGGDLPAIHANALPAGLAARPSRGDRSRDRHPRALLHGLPSASLSGNSCDPALCRCPLPLDIATLPESCRAAPERTGFAAWRSRPGQH